MSEELIIEHCSPTLVIALILVIPVLIIGMRIAEKVMKKQMGLLD